MTPDRDLVVARALRAIDVPEHGPGFWDGLDRRLQGPVEAPAAEGAGDLAPLVAEPPPAPRRERVARMLVVAAAIVLVVATAALSARNHAPRARVGPPATAPAPSTTTTTSPPSPEESAVLQFLDALGAGDVAGAAARLGPRSEAYLEATTGSVPTFLAGARDGYGAWATAQDRTTRTVPIRPGDEVVLVSGRVQVNGVAQDRTEAFPVRYAESAGVWFVEPWAFDPATGGRIQLAGPSNDNTVTLVTPAAGTAWLSVDGGAAQQTTVGPDHQVTWTLPVDLPRGSHALVLVFVNDTDFSALATSSVAG